MKKPLVFALFALGVSPLFSSLALAQEEEEEIILEEIIFENEEGLPPPEAPYVDAEENELARKEQLRTQKPSSSYQEEKNTEATSNVGPTKHGTKKIYIKHPNAKKGLYRITKDGEYLYKVNASKKDSTVSVRFSPFSAPNFINDTTQASFDEIYDGTNVMLTADYEWSLNSVLPNLSFKVGSGLMVASGEGRLESTGQESVESFSMILFPNHAALAYKFRFADKQWFYPYVEAGVGAFAFTERRDDNDPPLGRWGAAVNVHAVGGVAFSLTAINRDTALRLDAEYGVNGIWLTVDAKQIIGFGKFDLTTTLFNGGITVEF